MDETEQNSIEIEHEENAAPQSRKGMTIAIIITVLLIGIVIAGIVILSKQPQEITSKVRDIFIILLALEMFVVGIALIILIIQLASLSNLLQNEVKPILETTTSTVNNLKGTVKFLSDNLAEPVIKLNQTTASLLRLLQLLKLKK